MGVNLAQTGCRSCSKTESSPSGDPALDPGLADADPTAARKARLARLIPPSADPPQDAQPLGHGGHWRVVHPGVGESPAPADILRAELTIWRKNGQLAFSSLERPQESIFPIATTPVDVRAVIGQTRPGAELQLWLPRDLIAAAEREGHRSALLPIDDLLVDLQVISFETIEQGPASTTTTQVIPEGYRPPDAAGPPKDAIQLAKGAAYVVLRQGTGTTVTGPDSHVQMEAAVWHVNGLQVEGPATSPFATTPRRAPGALAKAISGAQEGQVLRVWLSPGRALEALPSFGAHESVCDISVRSVTN